MSLPVRERGLKQAMLKLYVEAWGSLPVRERGLKQFVQAHTIRIVKVAPRAGAWIETFFFAPLPFWEA